MSSSEPVRQADPAAPAPLGRLRLSRRRALGLAGGATLVAGFGTWAGRVLYPEPSATAASSANLYLAGTDGWISLPPDPPIGQFHPDSLAPDPFTTYIFGFRNVTGMDDPVRLNQKNHAQHSAPLFWVNEYTGSNEFKVQLTNLGLALRPDLFDAHTLHWHGFRNVIPFFDGEPTGSVSVPAGREFTYAYRPRDPGTYMYHCHVEDVEHVHMGMTGLVFVHPKQNGQSFAVGGKTYRRFLYNDGDGSTAYDRHFAMFLSEVWAEAHWADAHIQLPEWSDYRADFALLNGRVYPDTVAPPGPASLDPFHLVDPADPTNQSKAAYDLTTGELRTNTGYEHLQYQPISSLVNCNAGERVALRFSNLGFRESAMTITGIRMRVVGRDATLMRGLSPDGGTTPGPDTSYETDTINIGPGESYDVIFTAPPKSGAGFDRYFLYNRSLARSNNKADGGFGGQTTEIRVYASGVTPQGSFDDGSPADSRPLFPNDPGQVPA